MKVKYNLLKEEESALKAEWEKEKQIQEQIKDAKRDFKKMKELEETVRVPLEDIIRKIEFFKNVDNKDKVDNALLEKTAVLFDCEDIRSEINKELKIKNKNVKRNKDMK